MVFYHPFYNRIYFTPGFCKMADKICIGLSGFDRPPAIIPMYLSIFYTGAQSLLVLRALRLLRIFRIFKLTHFITEMSFLGAALKAGLKKISIFMMVVLALVIILGSIMYLVED